MVANNIWIQLRGAQSHSTHCTLVWCVLSPISLWSKTQLFKPVVCTVLNGVQCWVMTGLEEWCLSLLIPTGNMSTSAVKEKKNSPANHERNLNANWLWRQPLKASITDHLLPDMHFSRLSNPTKGGMTNRTAGSDAIYQLYMVTVLISISSEQLRKKHWLCLTSPIDSNFTLLLSTTWTYYCVSYYMYSSSILGCIIDLFCDFIVVYIYTLHSKVWDHLEMYLLFMKTYISSCTNIIIISFYIWKTLANTTCHDNTRLMIADYRPQSAYVDISF